MDRARTCPEIININADGDSKMYNNFVGENSKKQSKRSTWAQNIINYFIDYSCCSGVHGVRYLGERGRYVIEKLTWAIVITLVWYFCINLILMAYNKWKASPVIVTFAGKETPISRIPFPAVTICSEVKSDPEIFNFTDVVLRKIYSGYITPDEKRYYEAISPFCDGLRGWFVNRGGNPYFTVNKSAVDDMKHVFPAINTNFSFLHWAGDQHEINSIVSQSFTSEGVCYSFNMLHFDDILVDPQEYVRQLSIKNTKSKMWTLEDGYPKSEEFDTDTFPKRTFVPGENGGLLLSVFTNHSHLDYLCNDALQGFKVTLHLPSELPNMDRHFRLPLDQAVLVVIKPRMITASEELKSYKPEERFCYFATERKLTLFRSYTQQNCLDECLSNLTLAECGCVPFYMPKLDSSPICGPGSYECVQNSKVQYLLEQAQIEIDSSKTNNHSGCKCLPSCTSLEYDVEISQTDWEWRKIFAVFDSELEDQAKNAGFDYKMSHLSRLQLSYREMQFLSSERHEVYGLLDFLSNTGGFLGLFIGFSVTSAIEILHFLTLRLLCTINKFGRCFWSG